MLPRPSSLVLLLLSLGLLAFGWSFADANGLRADRSPASQARQDLTTRLGLTDLALMTEARYARHLSQADLHAPFQDHPLAFDLFPSGSLVPPPNHAPVDRTPTLPD